MATQIFDKTAVFSTQKKGEQMNIPINASMQPQEGEKPQEGERTTRG